MLTARRGSHLVAFVVAVALGAGLACSGDGGTEPPPTPTSLVRVSGDGQTADAGQQVPSPLVVRVNDAQGRGVAGVAVAFSVTQGGGSVGAASVTTGSDGQASTSWTVGTTAGSAQQARAQVTSPALGPVNFAATVVAGPAAKLERVSGDGQQSTQNGPLPQPLIVRVLDQYDNVVSGRAITWTVLTGGGSMNPAASTSQANGQAQTTWTLGPAGPQTAEASATGLLGSPVGFGATAINLALTSVSPDTLVEGQPATLTGDGFDPTPANNTVMVGGVAATVTGATATTLNITVPTYDCQPARDVGVQVTVGGGTTPAITKRVHPASFIQLAVGEQVIIQDPAQFCAQFRPSSSGGDAYLLGLSAAAETPTATLSFNLTGRAGAPTATIQSTTTAERSNLDAASTSAARSGLAQLRRGARLEHQLRAAEREAFHRLGPRATAAAPGPGALRSTAAVPNVGDTLRIRMFTNGNDPCGAFEVIDAVVRSIGQNSIWATDVIHPASDSLTDSDIAAFSASFDANAHQTDTSYFGVPSDIDNNLRVTVVLSPRVNQFGSFGYTFGGDFFSQGECASSNQGEHVYALVPDPSGSLGFPIQRADVVEFMAPIVAHEFSHVIQNSRRIFDPSATTLQAVWELEGQATFAEEVVGHATLGNQVAQNYGSNVVNQGGGTSWYQQAFLLLATYFGWDPIAGGRVANAPERCTLFAYDDLTVPCFPDHFYGTSFSLLRFVSDRFGPTYPGGERQIHRDLIGANVMLSGRNNLEAVLGASFDSVFAQWAAMLYVDGRVAAAAPEVQLTSWNLSNIFSFYNANLQLTPLERTFAGFTDARVVRAGSTAYTRIASIGARGALAVGARTSTGGVLSSTLSPQLWIVRLQ